MEIWIQILIPKSVSEDWMKWKMKLKKMKKNEKKNEKMKKKVLGFVKSYLALLWIVTDAHGHEASLIHLLLYFQNVDLNPNCILDLLRVFIKSLLNKSY